MNTESIVALYNEQQKINSSESIDFTSTSAYGDFQDKKKNKIASNDFLENRLVLLP